MAPSEAQKRATAKWQQEKVEEIKLGMVESKFADIVWQNEPLSTKELVILCEQKLNWKRTTTYTVLKKLCDRRIFKTENSIITSLISKEEFYSIQSEKFVEDTFEDLYPAIEGTTECGFEIAAEGYSDVHKLVSSMYITDILIENAVMEGAEAEPLVEGAVKEFKDKAVKKFKEIVEKIKNWFKKVIDRIKVRFTSTKDFVSKYRDALLTKGDVANDYKPARHDFVTDFNNTYGNMVAKISDYAKQHAESKDGDFVSNMAGSASAGAKSIADLKQSLINTHVGEANKKGKLSKSEVEEMIKYCDNSRVAVAALENVRDKGIKEINGFIAALNGSGKEVSAIHAATAKYNTVASAIQQLNTVCVKIVDDNIKEYVAVLRGLMLYKPAKESFTPDEELMTENKGQSMFEAALNLF